MTEHDSNTKKRYISVEPSLREDYVIDPADCKTVRVLLKITWSPLLPRGKQVVLLKNLVATLDSYSHKELLKMTVDSAELEIGEFNEDQAEEVIDKGNELGLRISEVRRKEISYEDGD